MKNVIRPIIFITVVLFTNTASPIAPNLQKKFSHTCTSLLLEDAPPEFFERAFTSFLDKTDRANLDPNWLLDRVQDKQLEKTDWSELYHWYYKFYRQLLNQKKELLPHLTPVDGTIVSSEDLSRNVTIIGEYLLTYTHFCIAKHLVLAWETDLPSYGTEPLAQEFWKHQGTELESNLVQTVTDLSNQCDSWSIAPGILEPTQLSKTYFDGFEDSISPRTLQLYINFMIAPHTKIGKVVRPHYTASHSFKMGPQFNTRITGKQPVHQY